MHQDRWRCGGRRIPSRSFWTLLVTSLLVIFNLYSIYPSSSSSKRYAAVYSLSSLPRRKREGLPHVIIKLHQQVVGYHILPFLGLAKFCQTINCIRQTAEKLLVGDIDCAETSSHLHMVQCNRWIDAYDVGRRCTFKHPSKHFYWTWLIDWPPAAQLGISCMACLVTGVMMRAEFSILGLVEIVGEVAIAAAVRWWFKLPFAPRIGHGSQLPPARVTWQRGSHGLRGLAQPGRRRSSVLKSCWASSSRKHGWCSTPTLDQDWSVLSDLWGTLLYPVLWGAMRAYDC